MFRVLLIIFALFISSAQSAEPIYWIAYISSDGEGCKGLCIVRSDGLEWHSLTENVFFASPIAWSPDGESIAYTNAEGDLYHISINDPEPLLIIDRWTLMEQLGASEEEIMALKNEPMFTPVWHMIWSESYLYLPIESGIYRLNVLTKDIEKIIEIQDRWYSYLTALSPDGQSLLYVQADNCSDSTGKIYRVRIDGNDAQLLNDECVNSPTWSGDGDYIYYLKWAEEHSLSVVRIQSDGQYPELVGMNIPVEDAYALVATDDHLFFVGRIVDDVVNKVFILHQDRSKLQIVRQDSLIDFADAMLSAAPETNRVALVGSESYLTGGGAYIYVMETDGSYKSISMPALEIYNPSWSPIPIQ